MRFEFSEAELFLAYLTNQTDARSMFAHPAYQTIAAHAQQFGAGMTPDDIDSARDGQSSPFYGLTNLGANLISDRLSDTNHPEPSVRVAGGHRHNLEPYLSCRRS